MWTRGLGVLAAGWLLAPTSTGCSFPQCYAGSSPPSGSTGLDPPFILEISAAMPDDVPSFVDALTLTDAQGAVLEIEVLADPEASTLWVAALAPLPDGVYTLRGNSAGRHHAHYWPTFRGDRIEVTVEVGGAAQVRYTSLLGAPGDDGVLVVDALLLAFSEPMDAASLDGQVQVDGQLAVVDGFLDDDPRLVVVELPDPPSDAEASTPVAVTFGEGARSARGGLVSAEPADVLAIERSAEFITWNLGGESYCE